MPNITQQKKRVRIAARQRLENVRYRSTVKTLTKTPAGRGGRRRLGARSGTLTASSSVRSTAPLHVERCTGTLRRAESRKPPGSSPAVDRRRALPRRPAREVDQRPLQLELRREPAAALDRVVELGESDEHLVELRLAVVAAEPDRPVPPATRSGRRAPSSLPRDERHAPPPAWLAEPWWPVARARLRRSGRRRTRVGPSARERFGRLEQRLHVSIPPRVRDAEHRRVCRRGDERLRPRARPPARRRPTSRSSRSRARACPDRHRRGAERRARRPARRGTPCSRKRSATHDAAGPAWRRRRRGGRRDHGLGERGVTLQRPPDEREHGVRRRGPDVRAP